MRVKEKTKDLAFIRRQIREAIIWHKTDDGMPHNWTTDNYKGSRPAGDCVVDFNSKVKLYYYVKSDRAIAEIAKKIYDKVNGKEVKLAKSLFPDCSLSEINSVIKPIK